MKGEQISPWSIYKQKSSHSPFKLQHKVLRKVQRGKIILPQIESSLYAIQMLVKNKLQNQQSTTLRRQENKTTIAVTSIHKIIKGNRKLSDDEKLKNAAQQNLKLKQINQEKEMFQNQINSLLVFKILYQQLKNQEEKANQKIQIKEMKEEVVQMIKSESQVLVKQSTSRNSELFPDIKSNRIHKSIQDISQDKLKEVLAKSAAYKISQRLKILWEGKTKGTSNNK